MYLVSGAFIRYVHMFVCACVCACVCPGSKTKATKLGRWIVHDSSWSPILFEAKRLNVKVTKSINVML